MSRGPVQGSSGVTLTATGVSKEISGLPLLAPVDLIARPGECVVLRGKNGSGKTTLLRILAGTLEPSAGRLDIDGQPVDERARHTRETVAALVGAIATYRDLTLWDHLVLVESTWGLDPDTTEDRVQAMLELLEIDHLDDRFPHELSSGQQQLFHLALVLIRPARLLLLDEPEQRLDTDKRRLLAQILAARAAQGTTVVMACHDPVVTEAVADRILDLEPAS
ncbi:MAG TPA: ABC transporter ATP-binding protein [Candidatus Lustribacter sp.]|nr:ABC transporter ATP-binding protein [Candidatus Lustribacter sp.]